MGFKAWERFFYPKISNIDHMKNNFIHYFILVCFASSVCIGAEHDHRKKPNVVVIMADDMGFETIGANGGSSYETPTIDRLAAAGARFTHAYAQPICTPSRVKMMTGQYNIRNHIEFGILKRDSTTFAHLLKSSGYATCIAGKWQLGDEKDSPQHFGFDESLLWHHTAGRIKPGKIDNRFSNPWLSKNGESVRYQNGEYSEDLLSDFICDFIRRNKEGPFFAYYPMILTHCPFTPTPDSDDWDPKSKGSKTYKGKARHFGDMVAYTDKIVAKVIGELEENNLLDNTIVIFTGDNGTDTPIVSMLNGKEVAGAKGKTTDAGTHVPFIVSWPSVIQPQVKNHLIDFADVLPTLCDFAGAEIPQDLIVDGKSFVPQLMGESKPLHEYLYCWYSRNAVAKEAKIFVRTHCYKLYDNGKFFDIENDPKEIDPLKDEKLSVELIALKKSMQVYMDERSELREKPNLMIR